MDVTRTITYLVLGYFPEGVNVLIKLLLRDSRYLKSRYRKILVIYRVHSDTTFVQIPHMNLCFFTSKLLCVPYHNTIKRMPHASICSIKCSSQPA